MPDAPFPTGMLPDIEKFFRETHPKLTPGQDWYPEVFATELFFPLQRPRELAEMIRVARKANSSVCPNCEKWGPSSKHIAPCQRCQGTKTVGGPVTVMEIGADKGGSLYHWCQCLPTVHNVIACEIRGTPYRHEFERAFPKIKFCWTLASKTDHGEVLHWLKAKAKKIGAEITEQIGGMTIADVNSLPAREPIDVLFIDGDKLGMLKDFDAYLPLMRKPGGIVFMHDISDDHPAEAFKALIRRGYKVDTIIDRSEGIDAASRADRGEAPRNTHDGWLMHWRGRSCGVGVIRL
jgi:hypothetical protein